MLNHFELDIKSSLFDEQSEEFELFISVFSKLLNISNFQMSQWNVRCKSFNHGNFDNLTLNLSSIH
ncbi:hypothetical protein bsdtb5_01390 [Anaeromicropila herbilytica]|uniref:Uncharacterized protein n=1 Tax=Anaeromicropila herbilytica TaxID=2785025 RepID=A0A7R7EHL1_9FIRM|nr:hypothetical protein bsdtb5_01390 [Anaeromicropila herbilytica]